MAKTPVYKNQTFQVKESAAINFFVSGFLFVLIITALVTGVLQQPDVSSIIFVGVLTIPAVLAFRKGLKGKVIIEVNGNGIHYHGKQLTDWTCFIRAQYKEEPKLAAFQDNFILYIEFHRLAEARNYISKIPLTNTQDKSEEEIIAAINHFARLAHVNS